jgi:hypothetical protein
MSYHSGSGSVLNQSGSTTLLKTTLANKRKICAVGPCNTYCMPDPYRGPPIFNWQQSFRENINDGSPLAGFQPALELLYNTVDCIMTPLSRFKNGKNSSMTIMLYILWILYYRKDSLRRVWSLFYISSDMFDNCMLGPDQWFFIAMTFKFFKKCWHSR